MEHVINEILEHCQYNKKAINEVIERLTHYVEAEEEMEENIKDDIERVLRVMCNGRSREWSENMVNRVYETDVVQDNCVRDDVCADVDIVVSALMEIVYKDYEYKED
jgi:hypothetical protein